MVAAHSVLESGPTDFCRQDQIVSVDGLHVELRESGVDNMYNI